MGRISLLRLVFLSLAAILLIITGCDELTTEVNNITVFDTTMGDECFDCHGDNDNVITLPRGQWLNSAHASFELIEAHVTLDSQVFLTSACGPTCHTSEGFIAFTRDEDTTVTRPTTIGCYTCHMPHSGNYGQWDADTLRNYDTSEEFVLLNNKRFYTWPDKNKGNGKSQMCVHCHQAPGPAPPDSTWEEITLTDGWGPHYSPQADVVSATGGSHFRLGLDSIALLHASNLYSPTDNRHGCLNCHYGTGIGYQFGEHTFRLEDDITGEQFVENCNVTGCHATEPLIDFSQEWSSSLYTDYVIPLRDSLQGRGYLNGDGVSIPSGMTLSSRAAQILYNFLLWEHDGSNGIHNPPFMDTLMKSTLAQWDSIPPVADFSISDSVGCAPLTVTFDDVSGGNVDSLNWDFGDGGTGGNLSSVAYEYSSPGIYTVTLEAFSSADTLGGLDLEVKADLITVVGPPVPAFAFSDTTGECNLVVTFTDLTDFGDPRASDSASWTWEWHFGDDSTSTEQNPVHTYDWSDPDSIFQCTLIVGSACGTNTVVMDTTIIVTSCPR